jgi:hypothetical protein
MTMTSEEIAAIIADSDARYVAARTAVDAAAARVRAVRSAQRTLLRVGLVREADALTAFRIHADDDLKDARAALADYDA